MDLKTPCANISISNVDQQYDRGQPMSMTVLGMNGKQRVVKDVWRLLKQTSFIRIPGHDFVLHKQSVQSHGLESNEDDSRYHEWALLLNEKGADGKLHRATTIDLRVGCTMDGAVVYYADGHKTNCGNPKQQHYGGHASQSHNLPAGASIVKVELHKGNGGWGSLDGIRMTLDDGTKWGELHDFDSTDYHEQGGELVALEPADGDRVIGFFGTSEKGCGFCCEFGIITAPKDRELPASVYDMAELKNSVSTF